MGSPGDKDAHPLKQAENELFSPWFNHHPIDKFGLREAGQAGGQIENKNRLADSGGGGG